MHKLFSFAQRSNQTFAPAHCEVVTYPREQVMATVQVLGDANEDTHLLGGLALFPSRSCVHCFSLHAEALPYHTAPQADPRVCTP